MANRERGEVAMVVEGKSYTLRPSFNALCEVETLTNRDAHEYITEALRGRLSAVRALMWCYLQEYHGDEIKTLKDAAEWIERAGGVEAVNAALEQVIQTNAAEGSEVGGDKGNPQPADGTGGTPMSPPAASASHEKSSGVRRRGSSTAH